jgi:hypothetical protein
MGWSNTSSFNRVTDSLEQAEKLNILNISSNERNVIFARTSFFAAFNKTLQKFW